MKKCVTDCSPNYKNVADKTCYSKCPDPYYNKDATKTCEKCNIKCLACTGPLDTDCTHLFCGASAPVK